MLALPVLSHAQSSNKEEDKKEAAVKQAEAEKRTNEIIEEDQSKGSKEQRSKDLGKSILLDASSIEVLDPPTKEQYYTAMREYYDYRIAGYKHWTEILNWQLFSSKIIFFRSDFSRFVRGVLLRSAISQFFET